MSTHDTLIAVSLFDGQVFALAITVLGFVSIPLVAILTRHQRHMAEIIHGRRRDDQLAGELEAVKAEVAQLRTNLRVLNPQVPANQESESLARRLG
ncbi:MAG: hypothetical protein ACYC96_01440 [Fimbriimonadaceae bacterium]